MKKILILATAILAVSFTSCSKDKDNKTNPLIGEWALLSNVEKGVDIKGVCGEYSYIIFTEKEIEVHSFKERVGCIEQIQKGGYTLSNNKIIFEANGEKSSASYVVNGDS
ncbi:lipocalin family protein [Capnocytophaga catalasegens]|uniref:Lipocalin-like domain-containing protein n=1 Tax=Capnocytophaga catalasegens TaxID=1004260 RepID=A0AAV5AXN8_9FLAO|nr:lipocalin family protein [Capnocytophaga catalasegens]GIZ15734.1 hypothetical protein RCZ03_17340 [Capnocytophaga catalasegens]GJM50121.1 hypothetical protein RCZ15_10950 [Capnocytophaga catalasegens]GJM53054.1 hypothetical protein RCZ16_13710 [Capnocytophaga catalasegens]